MNWKKRSTATSFVTFKDTLCNSSWHRNQAIETIPRIPAKQDLALQTSLEQLKERYSEREQRRAVRNSLPLIRLEGQ